MKTVHHPTIPDHSVDVADSAVQDWVEQGWRKTPLTADKAEAPASGTNKKES